MTRIANERREGHVAYSRSYAIGYSNCAACKAETPSPPQDVIDAFAREGDTRSTLWPGEDWEVPGWTDVSEFGRICDRCSRAVMALLASRNQAALPHGSVVSDLALLEDNLSHALKLARGAQLVDFPPPPMLRNSGDRRYQHPTKKYVWNTHGDYVRGMLLERIREIESALLGRPLNYLEEAES